MSIRRSLCVFRKPRFSACDEVSDQHLGQSNPNDPFNRCNLIGLGLVVATLSLGVPHERRLIGQDGQLNDIHPVSMIGRAVTLDEWVRQLGHRSATVRAHARSQIEARLKHEDKAEETLEQLVEIRAREHDDFEVVLALDEIIENELDRRERWTGSELKAWCGENPQTDALVDAMRSRYSRVLRAWGRGEISGDDLRDQLSPLAIPTDDAIQWAMLLYVDLRIARTKRQLSLGGTGVNDAEANFGVHANPGNKFDHGLRRRPMTWLRAGDFAGSGRERSSRIAMALAGPSLGLELAAVPDSDEYREPIERLIEKWFIHVAEGRYPREAALAGLRYHRREFAFQRCDSILRSPTSSPAALAAAILGMNKLAPDRLESNYAHFERDDRVAHVWQSVDSGTQVIRTQVSDVAKAARLQRAGHDPRTFGFKFLRADATTLFLPYSLGFVDEASRSAARRRLVNWTQSNDATAGPRFAPSERGVKP